MKKIIYLATIILLNFVSTSFSQSQVLFNKSNNESFVVEYGNTNTPKDLILKKMASATRKAPRNTQFSFSYTQEARIIRRGASLEVGIVLKNMNLRGDKFYKGFDLTSYLFPAEVVFSANLVDVKSNKVIKKYNNAHVKLKAPNYEILLKQEADTAPQRQYKIVNISKKFQYTQASWQKINQKIKLIDAYIAGNKDLKIRNKKMARIAYENATLTENYMYIDSIPYYKEQVLNNEQTIRSIRSQAYFRELNIAQNDPRQLKQKIQKLEQYNRQLDGLVKSLENNLYILYYNRGMVEMKARAEMRAEQSFMDSKRVNPTFAPTNYQLAKIQYNRRNYRQSLNILYYILEELRPEPVVRKLSNGLAENIHREYIRIARNASNIKNYGGAIEFLDQAAEICVRLPAVYCSQNLDTEYVRAVEGELNLYLHDADRSIEGGYLLDAENSLSEAEAFRFRFSKYLPDNKLIDQRWLRIFYDYISRGDELYSAMDYKGAVREYRNAKRICTKQITINCSQTLDNSLKKAKMGVYGQMVNEVEMSYLEGTNLNLTEKKLEQAEAYRRVNNLPENTKAKRLFREIKQAKYNNLISDGIALKNSSKLALALQKFDQAIEIEKTYQVPKDENLDNLIRETVLILIDQKIAEGEKNVEKNNLVRAKSYYVDAIKLQRKYNLLNDRATIGKINALQEKIFAQECANVQRSADEMYSKAVNYIFQKQFIVADQMLNKAINLIELNSVCELNSDKPVRKKTEISDAVMYQKELVAAGKAVKSGTYQVAVDKKMAATTYYEEYNIGRFGLTNTDLFSFAASRNEDFMLFTANYYIRTEEYRQSLAMLIELKNKGYSKYKTKKTQQIVASQLAKLDYSPSASYKEKIAIYTQNNRWFKAFQKSYKAQWKKQ